MKIDELITSLSLTPLVDEKPHLPAKEIDGKEPATATSGTNTNADATATQRLNKWGDDTNIPMMSASKIAEIKQAISEGRFQINSSAVADSLIETMRAFR